MGKPASSTEGLLHDSSQASAESGCQLRMHTFSHTSASMQRASTAAALCVLCEINLFSIHQRHATANKPQRKGNATQEYSATSCRPVKVSGLAPPSRHRTDMHAQPCNCGAQLTAHKTQNTHSWSCQSSHSMHSMLDTCTGSPPALTKYLVEADGHKVWLHRCEVQLVGGDIGCSVCNYQPAVPAGGLPVYLRHSEQ